jgi:hypothetical protein
VAGPEGALDEVAEPLASGGRLLRWRAEPGARLELPLPVERAGRHALSLVARHAPAGGSLRLFLDGRPLRLADAGGSAAARPGDEVLPLRAAHGRRILSLRMEPVPLEAGTRTLVLEAAALGDFAFDYLWLQPER